MRTKILALVVLSALPIATAAVESSPIALIYKLEGKADIKPVEGVETHHTELFDWLTVGDELRVEIGGRVAIAFVTGARYELSGPATVELAAEGFRRAEGKIEAQSPIPPLPLPPPGAHEADAFASTRLGGVVLRGSGLSWIYPRQGATTLARRTSLRFGSGPKTATGYRVVVENEDGAVLLHVVVKDAEVVLKPDLLEEGRRYYWRVLALEEAGTNGVAEGDFMTLDSVRSSQRQILRDQLASSSDPYLIALLAEADRGMGLLWESQENFCQAHRLVPEDAALQERCEELESTLQR